MSGGAGGFCWGLMCGFWGGYVECHEQMEANGWFLARVRGMP